MSSGVFLISTVFVFFSVKPPATRQKEFLIHRFLRLFEGRAFLGAKKLVAEAGLLFGFLGLGLASLLPLFF